LYYLWVLGAKNLDKFGVLTTLGNWLLTDFEIKRIKGIKFEPDRGQFKVT